MRILQVSNGYPHEAYGGVELHTYRVCNALAARGHEVRVFTRRSDLTQVDGSIVDDEVDGVPVRHVVNDMKAGAFRDHYLSAPVGQAFRQTLDEFAPDVVHVQHLIGLSADLPQVARAAGRRVVATAHDYWYVCQRVMFQHPERGPCAGPAHESCVACVLGEAAPPETIGSRARRKLRSLVTPPLTAGPDANRLRFAALGEAIRAYERIDTPSQFVVDELARHGMPLPADRTRVLALPIDRDGFPPPRPIADLPIRTERPLRLGFVGHALHHKGPHILLEALRARPELPIDARLWGPRHPGHRYDETLEGLLRAEPRATHHGRFAEGTLAEVLAEIDVLVVPSTCIESFGLATREAFVAGRPVLSSDRGALPESVRDGVDGLLVPGEDVAAFAAALARLAEEPELLPKLAAGAVESGSRVKSPDRYAAELEDFLYEPMRRS